LVKTLYTGQMLLNMNP